MARDQRRQPSVRAVEIELNRRLDMDEEAGEPLPSFGETEGHLAMRAAVGRHQQ